MPHDQHVFITRFLDGSYKWGMIDISNQKHYFYFTSIIKSVKMDDQDTSYHSELVDTIKLYHPDGIKTALFSTKIKKFLNIILLRSFKIKNVPMEFIFIWQNPAETSNTEVELFFWSFDTGNIKKKETPENLLRVIDEDGNSFKFKLNQELTEDWRLFLQKGSVNRDDVNNVLIIGYRTRAKMYMFQRCNTENYYFMKTCNNINTIKLTELMTFDSDYFAWLSTEDFMTTDYQFKQINSIEMIQSFLSFDIQLSHIQPDLNQPDKRIIVIM